MYFICYNMLKATVDKDVLVHVRKTVWVNFSNRHVSLRMSSFKHELKI